MSKFLNFPLRLERQAVKCLAVAAHCEVPLEPVRCETAVRDEGSNDQSLVDGISWSVLSLVGGFT